MISQAMLVLFKENSQLEIFDFKKTIFQLFSLGRVPDANLAL